MEKLTLFWLITLVCLLNINYGKASFFQFTNITCESRDPSLTRVEQCYIGRLNRRTNYMTMSFSVFKPIPSDIGLHLQLMIRSNGWKPFLYSFDIDLCRYWKIKYNSFVKMILGFVKQSNHSCPFTEKYIIIDRLMNTDISKRIRGLPLGAGKYAFSIKWSWKNLTRIGSQIYFDILNA